MTKKIIILTTILLVILAISAGIGFDFAKIKELAASHVDDLTATSTTLVNDETSSLNSSPEIWTSKTRQKNW